MPMLVDFKALRFRNFRRVWAASLLDQTGNWMQITGRSWLIYHITGSTAALGTVYFVSYLPQLLLSQFAGVFADRYDRRRLLIAGEALQAVGAAAIGVLAVSHRADLLTVSAVSLIIGIIQTLSTPAQQALVPSLVPPSELPSAISLSAATGAFTRVLGPLLSGGLISLIGVSWLFWGNAVSFLAIIGVWVATTVPRQEKMAERTTWSAIVGSVRFVRHTPPVAVAIGTAVFIVGIGNIYQPMAVAFSTKVLAHGQARLGASYYGILQASLGSGALFGVLGIAEVAKRRPAASLITCAFAFSALLIALGSATTLLLAIAVGVAIGVFHFALATLTLTVVQHETPDLLRGRVLSIYSLGFVGTLPLISVVGGMLAPAIGLQQTFRAFGLFCLICCIPLIRWAHFLPTQGLVGYDYEVASITELDEEGVISDPPVLSPSAPKGSR